MLRENCMTIFKIFKRDFPKVLKNAHSCLLLSGTQIIITVSLSHRQNLRVSTAPASQKVGGAAADPAPPVPTPVWLLAACGG